MAGRLRSTLHSVFSVLFYNYAQAPTQIVRFISWRNIAISLIAPPRGGFERYRLWVLKKSLD